MKIRRYQQRTIAAIFAMHRGKPILAAARPEDPRLTRQDVLVQRARARDTRAWAQMLSELKPPCGARR